MHGPRLPTWRPLQRFTHQTQCLRHLAAPQVLLPGHLLLKFLKEQLEAALEIFRAQVRSLGHSFAQAHRLCCCRAGAAELVLVRC